MEFSGRCDKMQAEASVIAMVLEAMFIRGYEISDIICASA